MSEPRPATILIVDDAADARQMLNEIIKPHCIVLLAKNGEQALDRARQKRPDLILLDVLMPGMSGFEVLAKIQADIDIRETPVIFLTGMDTDSDIERGLQYGAVDYITKPFVAEVVEARVLLHLRRSLEACRLRQGLTEFDQISGLPNKKGLLRQIALEERRARRIGSCFALLLFDLRHNNHGKPATPDDASLIELAEQLRTQMSSALPWLARVAANRLAVLLPELNMGDLERALSGGTFHSGSFIGAPVELEYRIAADLWRGDTVLSGEAFLDALDAGLDTRDWLPFITNKG